MTKRRNAPGEGSISRRPDGSYMARYPTRQPRADGKRPIGYIYGRTLREVQRELRKAIARRDAGIPQPDHKLTVKQYLTQWLEYTARPSVKPTTYVRHENTVRLHLIPNIGHHKLQDLTPQHVRKLLLDLQKTQAASTVTRIRAVLNTALQQAVRDGILQRNVASLVDRPRVSRTVKPGLPIEDAHALLRAVQGTRYEVLICVTLCFGLRRGEALGLRWKDVDLDKGVLHVTGQVVRLPGGKVRQDSTKGGKSRQAPIPTPLVTMLRRHKDEQAFYKRIHADVWQEGHDLVFPNQRGGPMEPGRYNIILTRYLKAAKLPHYNVHALRHSAVSFLRALHVPDSVIMAVVGHANLTQTSQYGGVLDDLQSEALDKMGGLLFGGG